MHLLTSELPLSSLKIVLILLFLKFGFVPVQGQVHFEFTPLWLPQTNWLVNSDDYNAGASLDYQLAYSLKNVGALLGIRLASNIGIEGGFIFSQQGQKYVHVQEDEMGAIDKYTTEVKLDYHKIPILFFYKSPKRFGGIVKLGAQLSYLQSVNYFRQDKELFFSDAQGNSFDLQAAYAKRNIDLVVGYGPIINLNSNLAFYTLFRLDYSLNDIENKTTPLGDSFFFNEFRLATNAATLGVEVGVKVSFP